MPEKYRLVTRSDFDGLVCALLLKEKDLIDEVKFVHPKDMQDGKIDIGARDITTNLPYVQGAHLVFDHHASEMVRNTGTQPDNYIIDPEAPSAARVVYEYYGGAGAFPHVSRDMMEAVDKGDSAQFTRDDIISPKGWVLLNFLMDPRTGLGRFRNFRISNYQLMMELIEHCRNHTIEEVLELPDVKDRVNLYFEQQEAAIAQLRRCSTVRGNVVVVDLRQEEEIAAGNRFMIYTLYPECNISIHAMWGLKKQNTVLAVGASIFNLTSKTDIGRLLLEFDGGGHAKAGTCQCANEDAQELLDTLVQRINADNA